MSQQGYSRRVKNIGAQLNKKMNNFVEAVAATPSAGVEGYSEVVLNAMEVTPTLGCLLWVRRRDLMIFF